MDIGHSIDVNMNESEKCDDFRDDSNGEYCDNLKIRFQDSIKKMQDHSSDKETENSDDQKEEVLLLSEKTKFTVADRNRNLLEWEGDIGNSKRKPIDNNGELAETLRGFGIDGIEYEDGNVDFSPVSLYEIEFSTQGELYKKIGEGIKIGSLMTEDGVKPREELNKLVRNEWQNIAKEEIISKITNDPEFAIDFQDKTGIDTTKLTSVDGLNTELSRTGLTLHETPDCKKIQFVPTAIHNAFTHTGGTAEMLERLINGDYHLKNQ